MSIISVEIIKTLHGREMQKTTKKKNEQRQKGERGTEAIVPSPFHYSFCSPCSFLSLFVFLLLFFDILHFWDNVNLFKYYPVKYLEIALILSIVQIKPAYKFPSE